MLVKPRRSQTTVAVQYPGKNTQFFNLIIESNGYSYNESRHTAFLVDKTKGVEEMILPSEWAVFDDEKHLEIFSDEEFRAKYVHVDGTDII